MLKETDEEGLACKISDEIKESIRAINVIFELMWFLNSWG